MKTIADIRRSRLHQLITERFSGRQAGLVDEIGINQGELSAILRGEKSFGEKKARKLEEQCKLPVQWFDTIDSGSIAPKIRTSADLTIPQFDTGGAMGHGLVLRDQAGVIENWSVSPEWLRANLHGYTSTKNICIVTGFGDSMRPLFNPGDPLIVDTSKRIIDRDGVYFFRVGDEGFVKRLQRVPGNGLMAISDNSRYIPWTITPEMDFEVFGRVVKVWRSDDL